MDWEDSFAKPVDTQAMARYFDEALEHGQFLDFDPDEAASARLLVERIAPRPGDWIFEPGCGTGRFTRLLAERAGPHGRVEACEMAPRMAERFRQRRFPANVVLHETSALQAPAPLGSFHLVACINVWPHLPDAQAHLERFHSLLRPGGQLAIAHSLSRECVNAIHQFVDSPRIRARDLRPAADLLAWIEARGWRPGQAIDGDLFLVTAFRAQ
ncbi:MAG: Malonyl-(acyl-carrier protein) O-methyltransferase [candidate division BRC1 bacterium ADurb.BinA364]|nr:MAG: Malonyl-(acyl-carrier protein) O-methyltransferase [candidate division BRC1 bacterium ADurb.BinA364]